MRLEVANNIDTIPAAPVRRAYHHPDVNILQFRDGCFHHPGANQRPTGIPIDHQSIDGEIGVDMLPVMEEVIAQCRERVDILAVMHAALRAYGHSDAIVATRARWTHTSRAPVRSARR